ncbi:MAG TPA: amidohydrolase family protein [Acidimicrobiales bacterium]|nr:amidohydrolase family protein [Acidimicrobiales bacterium]
MPYVEGRVVHDADSHIFEPPGYAEHYADPGLRARLTEALGPIVGDQSELFDAALAKQDDPEFRAHDAEEVLLRKNFVALGAVRNADRPAALDHLGFASQLVFTTTYLGALNRLDHGDDGELAYGLATAHNRGMVDFCSADRRLLPVAYVPFTDIDGAARCAAEAIEMGAAALMIASAPPRRHSPSHVGFDRVWAQAEEAGVPIVLHVGGEKPMDPVYKENGLPPVPDFHGGDANFTSVSYMAIPYSPMQTLSVLIVDGVLDRFPGLRIGVIELGASWVPGWMRSMDSAAEAFRRNEERLQRLSARPSEIVRRQIRVTPYPHEDAGWIVEHTGPEVAMFSSDYPHVEGGRNPMKRFTASLEGRSDAERDAFYRDNFADLMGPTLDRVGISAPV